jgi:hypothetical protein
MSTLFPALLLLAALSAPGEPTNNCGPKQAVSDALATQFGEFAFASGVSVSNSVKFFGNPQTGTWTLVVVQPDGMACIVALGDGLELPLPTPVGGNAEF